MTGVEDWRHGRLEANGISIHYVEVGEGPLVVFCHGWPESWYSWRHQLPVVAEAGFRAVAAFSVPFRPPIGALPDGVTVTMAMEANAGPDRDHYRLFFQKPGVAEADFEADLDRSVRGVLYTISGDAIANGHRSEGWDGHFPKGETVTQQFTIPEMLPAWLTEEDVAFYVDQHARAGSQGGFNWYRNIDAMPAITGPFVGSTIEQPAFSMAGLTDMIAGNTADNLVGAENLPDLRHFEILEGVGHWIQQERPEQVNSALVRFLDGLD